MEKSGVELVANGIFVGFMFSLSMVALIAFYDLVTSSEEIVLKVSSLYKVFGTLAVSLMMIEILLIAFVLGREAVKWIAGNW